MAVKRHFNIESSSMIKSFGYDPNEQKLEVVFKTTPNSVYTYHQIPPLVFAFLANADSIGEFFAKSIKSYKFTKADRPQEPTLKKGLKKR